VKQSSTEDQLGTEFRTDSRSDVRCVL